MSLYPELILFLAANGVTQTTAQQVSFKIQQKVRMRSNLSIEEVTLAHEFIERGARPGAELSQLNTALGKSVARLPRTSMIGGKVNSNLLGDKTSARNLLGDKTSVRNLLGDKTSARNLLGDKTSARSRPTKTLPSRYIDKSSTELVRGLQPSDIRQLANHIVNT